jgi:hypothetical protein
VSAILHKAGVASFFVFLVSFTSLPAQAGKLKVTTTPSGATVEIDGSRVCSTPCELKYPGDYFHKPHTVFASRLEHSMVMKLSKAGFRDQEIKLTDGPIAWTDLKGRKHGEYYILSTSEVNVELEPLPRTVSDTGNEIEHVGPIQPSRAQTSYVSSGESSGGGTIKMESDPPGAEIYVDGNFVGQTPAVISLGPGLHHLAMKAVGKRAWEKDLDVLKDSQISLHPTLDSFSDDSR